MLSGCINGQIVDRINSAAGGGDDEVPTWYLVLAKEMQSQVSG